MLALLGGLTVLSSCDSMDESYKGYLEGGEIVYRAKAKELIASPGHHRVKLEWQLEYPTQVVKCEVCTGDKVLAVLPVKYDDLVKMECTIDNLEEQTYTFSVYSFDAQGNRSIKTDVIVDVYGERYIASLRAERSVEEVLRKADTPSDVMIMLPASSSTKLTGTDFTYKSTSNKEETIHLLPTQNTIEIADVAADSYFILQDSWKPVANAIDEFKAPIQKYEADQLPVGSARTFTEAYKTDDTTVIVNLSTAASNVLRSVISYGDQTMTIEPGTKTITLENVPLNAVLEMVTFVKKGETDTEYTTVEQILETSPLQKKTAANN